MKPRINRLLCLAAAASLIFSPAGKAAAVKAEAFADKETVSGLSAGTDEAADFSVRLFRESLDSEKYYDFPLSVLYALAMTANGARGETLSQMEAVLGMPVSELNTFLSAYKETLASDDTNRVHPANSIWFKDAPDFHVNPEFIRTNEKYYDASIYKEPFDSETLSLLNSWVEEQTMGMIDKILDELPKDAVMCLINALAFDGEWEEVYQKYQVQDGTFTTRDGTEHTVPMMYSDENVYLDDENAKGFLKYYKNRRYAFAALLPDTSVSAADYAASLTGEKLTNLLKHAQQTNVSVSLPVFTSEFSVEMKDILRNMGMDIPFDSGKADFSGLGTGSDGNICIDKVFHKTYISVNEKGTEAAASTAAVMVAESALITEKEVFLDRPFLYAVIDCETKLPLFIGTLMNPES